MSEIIETNFTITVDNVVYKLYAYDLDDNPAYNACGSCALRVNDVCVKGDRTTDVVFRAKIISAISNSDHGEDCISLDDKYDCHSYFYKKEGSLYKTKRRKLKL